MSTRLTPEARFLAALKRHQRVAIAGVGGSGKTTHYSAMVTDRPVIHTDDFISKTDFEGDPKRCAAAVPAGPVVIEGVRAIAVAKLLGDVTCVIWLDQPHESVRYTPEQDRAAKGRRTNFAKWLRENRDVEVVRL